MTLKVALCDDNQTEQDLLRSFLAQYEIEHNIDFEIATFSDGKELLQAYQEADNFHLLLLDMEMPNMNGLDAAKYIRKNIDKNVNIIFISHYPEYMQQSMHVRPFFYLNKPVTYEMFQDIMDEFVQELSEKKTYVTLVHTDLNETMLHIKELYYVETQNAKKKQLLFHTEHEAISVNGIITEWETRLENYGFMMCNRGLLVNLAHIHYIDNKSLYLTNGEKLPVSRNKLSTLKSQYINQVATLPYS